MDGAFAFDNTNEKDGNITLRVGGNGLPESGGWCPWYPCNCQDQGSKCPEHCFWCYLLGVGEPGARGDGYGGRAAPVGQTSAIAGARLRGVYSAGTGIGAASFTRSRTTVTLSGAPFVFAD